MTSIAPSAPLDDEPHSVAVGLGTRAWASLRNSPLTVIGFLVCLGLVVMAAFAPWIAPFPEDAGAVVKFHQRLQPPSAEHWFGTDLVGRDVLSRIVMGSRISLATAVAVIVAAALIGVPLGVIAAYRGGWTGASIMRINEVFLAIPSLVFVLVVTSLMRPSLPVTIFAIALAWWTWYARLAYGEVLSLKEEQFVDAARTSGASDLRIAFGEILPNLTSVLIVKTTLDLGYVILLGASLGFLGLGPQPPAPEWGTMVAEGREQLPDAWWLTTFPGLAVFAAVVGFNLFGDGLNDILGGRD
ncbi:MAG: ABC transporter permease [Alphaproteobacteria bacterium]|nr:ABC transporter permease [Alphaproteobacteria bacterium]